MDGSAENGTSRSTEVAEKIIRPINGHLFAMAIIGADFSI